MRAAVTGNHPLSEDQDAGTAEAPIDLLDRRIGEFRSFAKDKLPEGGAEHVATGGGRCRVDGTASPYAPFLEMRE